MESFLPGAEYLGNGKSRFCVWAPEAEQVEVRILTEGGEKGLLMEKGPRGYHWTVAKGVAPGALYMYRLDGEKDRPDPASRFQPQGVHGPSQLPDPDFQWEDRGWRGLPLTSYILYELHVGTFTPEGAFDAIIPYLDGLKELGITAVELMPVAQFPGDRNWGYDGVYPFAVHNTYGGPNGLKRLVNACHRRGLCVVLDVVYNHLGPEGNYLWDYAPYFTDRYKTQWGSAVNFDGPHSDEVRHFFMENADYWIREFHMDALRLDAVHAIFDFSARPFLEELSMRVKERAAKSDRQVFLIAESALNDTRLIRPRRAGGFALDAQWNDDFHHALHTLLTGEKDGYYQDFGELHHLVRALGEGYVYSGEYSLYRKRRHGIPSREIPARKFVVFAQNHDQVGNRMQGDRLTTLVSFEALKLAASVVLLSPYLPLLFMGEEYGETAPFPYFISHLDPDLVEAVRRGRYEEFAAFQWRREGPPDPQSTATFLMAKLERAGHGERRHRALLGLYKELIRLRKTSSALGLAGKEALEVQGLERERVIAVRRWSGTEQALALLHFGDRVASVTVPCPAGTWEKRLDTAQGQWEGPGSPAPERLASEGRVHLAVPPKASVLFILKQEGRG